MRDQPLYASQYGRHIISRTPSVLQDIQAKLACGVDIRVEHLADEFNSWRFVRVLLLEMHDKAEGTVFEGGIYRSDYDGVPVKVHREQTKDNLPRNPGRQTMS